MKTTNEIIIVDLEATCWENDRIPIGQKVDIIEMGICKLDLISNIISQKTKHLCHSRKIRNQ